MEELQPSLEALGLKGVVGYQGEGCSIADFHIWPCRRLQAPQLPVSCLPETLQEEGLKTRTREELGELVSFSALVSYRPSELQTIARSAILSGAATKGSHRGPGDQRS